LVPDHGHDSLTLAEQSLFGIDIDPWAVDAAAYVLLYDALQTQFAAHANTAM
jgi:hypothetical protein